MKTHPQGIRIGKSGDAENLAELSDGFASAMRNGLIMVYAVLVLLFGSFLQPITILFSLPLSIGGAIIALLLGGMQLTVPVSIGILMLMGIVTKNAIMLVDFAIESIHAGMDRDKAIIDAGQKRARPIVMTTIAMIAGMVPSALAFGAGGEFRAPMAVSVIGGLLCLDRALARLRSGGVRADGQRVEVYLAPRRSPHLHGRAGDQGRLGASGRP